MGLFFYFKAADDETIQSAQINALSASVISLNTRANALNEELIAATAADISCAADTLRITEATNNVNTVR